MPWLQVLEDFNHEISVGMVAPTVELFNVLTGIITNHIRGNWNPKEYIKLVEESGIQEISE